MSIQAVFWDYDNTILETAEAHWNKHKIELEKHGIVLHEKYRKRIYENNGNQNWEWMHSELGLTLPQKEYLAAVDAIFQEQMIHLAMRPGVAELFELFHQQGIPQAIITNARRDSAEPVLKVKGILALMKFVLYKEDYEGRKPEPTPYLKGFERMAALVGKPLNPKQCLAIEDDPKGVESAHRAGAKVVHRKLCVDEEVAPYADVACFTKNDFIQVVQNLLISNSR